MEYANGHRVKLSRDVKVLGGVGSVWGEGRLQKQVCEN